MACYHPLKGFPTGLTENGKTNYRITSYKVDHIVQLNGKWYNVFKDNLQYFAPFENDMNAVYNFEQIPCGQCIGCRLQRSRDWANRCMLELGYHKDAYFLTLTYDDLHLPTVEYTDDFGTVSDLGTLVKRDFQLFIKRLRKHFEDQDLNIRYFACGEYGSNTARPHYHCILYGVPLNDLVLYKRSPLGDNYYNSMTLDRLWNKGFCVVGEVTWESCAYVARYITKKKLGKEAEFYNKYGIVPEFVLMSRKPGIGKQYFDDNLDHIYDSDFISVSTPKGGRSFKPPKYFQRLYDEIDSEFVSAQKELNKQFSIDMTQMKLESTSNSYLSMLEVEENQTIERCKALVRDF